MAGERILVVDDDPGVLQLCTRTLTAEGYQVQEAGGGQEALARLEDERFDLLLVDIKMPEVDGLAVLQQARQFDPGVAAVIITGYGTLENAIEALRTGARGFLLKPFDPDELLAAVSDALERKWLEQENLRLKARLPILEMSQALMPEANVGRMAERLLEIVVREVGADRASLLLLDEKTNELYVAGAIGLPAGIVNTGWIRVGHDFVEQTLSGDEPLILNREADSELDPSLQALLTWPDVIATVCLPLHTGKKTIGALNLCRLLDNVPFSRDDLDLLSIMSSQIAIALENARLYEVVARSKREWEATFDAIADGISIHDADFRIVRANRALAERLGTTPRALVGRTCYELFHHSQSPLENCPHASVMQNGQPQSIELEEPVLGGTFQLSTYPLRNGRGEITGSVHVLRDITAQKQIQASLIQTEKLAALGCLAASLAHEINNPLQALRSGLRLLVNRPLEEKKRQRYLEIASREVERVIAIVERVLNFYRPSAEQRELTAINEVVDETLALAGKRLQHGRVVVRRELAAGLPPVEAVGDQLKQVFLNIVLNALEAMPDGGELTVKTGWEQTRQEVWIAFTDTGEGIPPENLSRIFEPFYTTRLKGTGLGLSISHGIVERHGGRIEVESEVGRGSTFTVWLPVGGQDHA